MDILIIELNLDKFASLKVLGYIFQGPNTAIFTSTPFSMGTTSKKASAPPGANSFREELVRFRRSLSCKKQRQSELSPFKK